MKFFSSAEEVPIMNRWSARFRFEKTGKEILDKAKSGSNWRYVAVNLNNYHTITNSITTAKSETSYSETILSSTNSVTTTKSETSYSETTALSSIKPVTTTYETKKTSKSPETSDSIYSLFVLFVLSLITTLFSKKKFE